MTLKDIYGYEFIRVHISSVQMSVIDKWKEQNSVPVAGKKVEPTHKIGVDRKFDPIERDDRANLAPQVKRKESHLSENESRQDQPPKTVKLEVKDAMTW